MKQFYVVKNRNYTTICNVALRDNTLSLKAKGLYCFIASLPAEWDYTVAGLVAVLKEGREAVLNALQELEKAGYLKRVQVRSENGTFANVVYILYEHPKNSRPLDGFPDVGEEATKDNNFVIKESEKRKSKKKRSKVMGDATQHFANERTYTQEELDGLIDDIDDIEF